MKEENIDFRHINLKEMGIDNDYIQSNLNDDLELQKEMRKMLDLCQDYYNNLQDFRARRERSRDFYRGDQWNDKVQDPNDKNKTITEAELIRRRGKAPMKNNQIRQLIKNLLGQYRENDYKPVAYPIKKEGSNLGDMLTNAIQSVHRDQEIKELDTRAFEEFLLSGYICWKNHVEWDYKKDSDDVAVDTPNATRGFWNTDIKDVRMKELSIIGEIHDVTLDQAIHYFAEGKEDTEKIAEWYKGYGDEPDRNHEYWGDLYEEKEDNLDFYTNNDPGKVRVFEVWRKELTDILFIHDLAKGEYYQTDMTEQQIEELNQARIMEAAAVGVPEDQVPLLETEIKKEYAWFYYFLTPKGQVLSHGQSEYQHQEHPYTLRLYPLIDGMIWGFVEDIIDQQKQINKMITLIDFMVGAGAKGLLMIPEDMLGDKTPEDFSDEWTKFNGTIVYKPSNKHNHMPKQITANSQNAGASDLLSLQLDLLQKISGVNEAIQGHRPPSGTPASLYAQQSNNAAITNKDIFEFFFSAKRQRDFKVAQLIQQYWDEPRWINISGNDFDESAVLYEPDKVRDLRFDIVIGAGQNSPVYRQIQDEWLLKFFEMQAIDLPTLLENSSLPFKDNLLKSIKTKELELQKTISNGEIPNELTQQMLEGQQGGQPLTGM